MGWPSERGESQGGDPWIVIGKRHARMTRISSASARTLCPMATIIPSVFFYLPPCTGPSQLCSCSAIRRRFRLQLWHLISDCRCNNGRGHRAGEDALRIGTENHNGREFLAKLFLSRIVDLPSRRLGHVRRTGEWRKWGWVVSFFFCILPITVARNMNT